MLDKIYTDAQIIRIREQAFAYHCACPSQVCVAIDAIRALYDYQMNCLDSSDADRAVHECIRKTSEANHRDLEGCLTEVLQIEGWDMITLKMPEGLRKRLLTGA